MKIFVKAKPGAREEKVDPPPRRLWQGECGYCKSAGWIF